MSRLHAPSECAAMTFEEIAKAMGYRDPEGRGKNAVWQLYRRAMRKLRSHPETLEHLVALAADLSEARASREVQP